MMSKILILANNDLGLYKFRKELIIELLKSNDVYISLPNGQFVKPLVDKGCHFINTDIDRRGINLVKDLFLLLRYLKIIRKVNPDLIITYTIKPNIYGSIIARLLKKKYAVNITGLGTAFQKDSILRKFIVFLYKLALKKAYITFFENEENRNIFVNEKIVTRDRTEKLNGAGVNLDEYPFEDYPKENENIRFLFIGRIMKEKGIDEFLYVAQQIKNEYPDVQFDVVGPMEDNYKDIIDDYVLRNLINYYGYQSDVKPFIKRCHCFVLPSYHEGMANTLLEAASMGRPIITSNIHGCKEAINNNGYLVKVKDGNDLYYNINKFIKLDYQDKVLLSKNSRKHIEKVFDKRKIVKQTIKFLL